MSMMQTRRGRRDRRASRSLLQLECLDRRLPLAGNVTAELTGSTLRLTGDTLGNEVVVASVAGGTIAVLGIDTTINGATAVFVTDKAVTAVIANLAGGDDAIGFGNSAQDYANSRLFADNLFLFSSPDHPPVPFDVSALQSAIDTVAGGVTTFSIRGSLTVTTGGGNDSVGIAGSCDGSVTVNLGPADLGNALIFGSEISASRVGGSVTVAGGDQADIVALGNVTVAGALSAALGDGPNWMIVVGAPVSTVGSFAYTGGAHTDVVGFLGDITVRNNVNIFTGSEGEDEVRFESGVTARGSVVINTGTGTDADTVDLAGDVRGTLSVTTGGGGDAVRVSATIGLDLTVAAGASNDQITIDTSTVARNATIDAGAGNDGVRIRSLQVRRNLFVRLGAGDDTLAIGNSKAFAAFLSGGAGTNWLSTDTTTRTVTRRLNFHRFQTVTNG